MDREQLSRDVYYQSMWFMSDIPPSTLIVTSFKTPNEVYLAALSALTGGPISTPEAVLAPYSLAEHLKPFRPLSERPEWPGNVIPDQEQTP